MAKPKSDAPDRTVSSATRTLEIINAISMLGGKASLTELAEKTGLFKSVILRYAAPIEALRYISRGSDGRYQLGSRLYELGCQFERGFSLAEYVLPVLQELTNQTQESSNFFVRDGDARICLFKVDSPQHLRASVPQGTRLPMDKASAAQVLRRDFVGSMDQWTPDETIVETSGVSNDVTSHLAPTASIAAPVLRYGNVLVGALTLAGPALRISHFTIEYRLALIAAARRLSISLGAAA